MSFQLTGSVTVEVRRIGDKEPMEEVVDASQFDFEDGNGDGQVDHLRSFSGIFNAYRDGYQLSLSISVIGGLMPDDEPYPFYVDLEITRPSDIEDAQVADNRLSYVI